MQWRAMDVPDWMARGLRGAPHTGDAELSGARWSVKYRIVEVEVGRRRIGLQLDVEESGVAVVMRNRGNPVGFAMLDLQHGASVDAACVERTVSLATAATILRAALRDELSPAAPTGPLPSLTLAICTKDRPDLVARCLGSVEQVRRTSPHRDVLLEVLVIDNAPSDDRTATLVETFPWARRCLDSREGLDFARNTAWREARGDFVAYLDDDAVLDAGWLDGFVDAWRRHQDAGAFTGLVLPFSLETEAQILFERRGGFGRGFVSQRFTDGDLDENPCYPTGAGSFGAGCNMILRRELLHRIGGFDEALDTGAPLPGGGDLDIFYRVIRSPAPLVYEPRLLVFHEHRRTMPGLRRQYYTWGLGFMAFVAKTWNSDKAQRSKLLKLLVWWTTDQLKAVADGVFRRGVRRFDHTIAELCGGIIGLMGTYSRSRRRSARIRAAHQQ